MRDTLIGTRINRYDIRESIHKSDLIGIYKAYDTKLERFVLIKTILHSSDYSKEAVDFFLAESRSLAKLAHPNIAKVLDFGYENGNLYLVSEFVPGVSLSDMMNNPMPWQTAINIILPLTNALIYAHSRGIIHRDLKPDNIIINTDDQPILSDFSLMRIIEEEETRDMTGTNVGLGSPGYISPEQGQGLTVDFRSDIYSLGVIFFEMVTGKKLFYATSSMEIVIQHIMADPPKPRSIIPTLPKMVETVILNALSKDREKRYQTMEEFSDALKEVIEVSNRQKNKSSRRPTRLIAFSVGAILLLTVVGLLIRNQISATTSTTPDAINTIPAQVDTPRITPSPVSASATPAPSTPTPSTTTSNDLFDFYQLSALPVIAGTKLPASQQLTVNNIGAIRELARWEKPVIRQIALINNDRVMLAATSAGIYFYDPNDLTARFFFDTQGALAAFTVSDDGAWVATADVNGAISVWNVLDGRLLYHLQDKDYTAKNIRSMDFSPDKSKLIFSDSSKNIHFWNLAQNQYYPFKARLGANANKVLFLNEGSTVISGGDENRIMFWDVASADLIREMNLPTTQTINDMALSADNRYVAVALDEAYIEIWDLFAKQKINTIKDPNIFGSFTSITFQPNQSTILTGSADGLIRSWNVSGASPLWEVTSANQSDHPEAVNPVESVMVTRDGNRFVVKFADGLIETWDLVNQKREASKQLGSVPIKHVVVSPNDQILALQGADTYVEFLSLADDSRNIKVSGTLPGGYPISPDSTMISIVPLNRIDQLELYSLSATSPAKLFTFYDYPVFGSVNYSPDNNILASYRQGNFSYWSTSSGRELKESLPIRVNLCYTIHHRDGSFIAAGTDNGVVYTDANLGNFCTIQRNARTTSEKFLSDGSIMAMSLQNQRIEVWTNEGQKREITTQSRGDVMDVAISNDGTLLAAASQGGVIEIYNLETMNIIKTLEVLTGPINHVSFTNNGNYLIAGSEDGTLRIYGIQQ
jgi:serine/threonine protein kinase/WD40 repeat protein